MAKPVYSCGLAAALDVVGGKWKPLVMYPLFSGPRRFGQLRREIGGISEKMLIQNLRELETDGVISRHDFGEIPPRVEYAMTEFGFSLVEALKPLCAWGTTHMEQIATTKEGLATTEPTVCRQQQPA